MEKIAKFFRIKGAGFILLAFAAGILLLLFPSEKTEAEKPSKNEYIESLEKNLKNIVYISAKDGSGYDELAEIIGWNDSMEDPRYQYEE